MRYEERKNGQTDGRTDRRTDRQSELYRSYAPKKECLVVIDNPFLDMQKISYVFSECAKYTYLSM